MLRLYRKQPCFLQSQLEAVEEIEEEHTPSRVQVLTTWQTQQMRLQMYCLHSLMGD